MEALKTRIQREGRNLGRGILKVDSFINHQLDPALMQAIGQAFADYFQPIAPTANKILTAEISGIAPALMTGYALNLPVVYARKHKPITMPAEVYHSTAPSRTKGKVVDLMISPEFLHQNDQIVIIDDFLATGQTLLALVELVQKAGATVLGIGTVIEKRFETGRQRLEVTGLPIYSLAIIDSMDDDQIIFAKGNAT